MRGGVQSMREEYEMSSAPAELERRETIARSDVYMHVWPFATRSDGLRGESTLEVELIASHTSNPNHRDPSCPACHRLRPELQLVARSVVETVRSTDTSRITFEIYADHARIVCSAADRQRPCVTVSIYLEAVWDGSPPNSLSAAVGRIKQALGAVGIRER
jgi:hypothetical protein